MAATTWNPADKHANIDLTNGDLTATHDLNVDFASVRSVYGASSGKYYWEVNIDFAEVGLEPVSDVSVGTSAVDLSLQVGSTALGWTFQDDAVYYHNNSAPAASQGFVTGNKVMVALDMDNGKLWWGVNGTWNDSGNPSTGANAVYTNLAGTIYAIACLRGGNNAHTANFGASAFSYTVPTGFTQGFGTGLPGGSRKKSSPIWL